MSEGKNKQSCDLLLKGASLIVNDAEGTVIDNGAIAIRDGKIVEAGTFPDLSENWQALEIKDPGHVMLMPGLVNAHTHVPMTFLRGFADDLPLMEWLTRHIFPLEAQLTSDIVSLGARLGMYEMMRTGTTAFVDSYLDEGQVLQAAELMGMRCVGGEVVFAFPSRTYSGWAGAESLYREHVERYPVGGRVQIALMPHSVYTTNDDILAQCVKLAGDLDLMLHIHLSESSGEVAQSMDLHQGRRPVAYARDMGLLSERSVLAHMVELSDDELGMVAASGAQIVHNPVSNLKLASGFARVADMARHGISVAIGTDGACSNNTLDMFESMKLAAILSKGREQDATVIPAQAALHMATVEGARIFRQPGLGSIVPGAPADVIALDLDEPNLCPVFSPVSHAVYAASGKDCVMTMVNGRILYERGRYADGRYDDTRREAADLVEWVRQRASDA